MTARWFASEVERLLDAALERDDQRRGIDLTERQFQDQIVELAHRFGWLVVHHGGNQHKRAYYDTTGFPDLLLVGPTGKVLFRELKAAAGKLTVSQERWAHLLEERKADYALWRPADWVNIVTLLSDGKAAVS